MPYGTIGLIDTNCASPDLYSGRITGDDGNGFIDFKPAALVNATFGQELVGRRCIYTEQPGQGATTVKVLDS